MKTIKFLVCLLILSSVHTSCDRHDDENEILLCPFLEIKNDSEKIHLKIKKNGAFYLEMLTSQKCIHPDYVELYQSDELNNNYILIKEIALSEDDDNEMIIENLTNGKSYFYYVVGKKRKYQSVTSDIYTIVPGLKPEQEVLFESEKDYRIYHPAYCSHLDKFAWTNNHIESNASSIFSSDIHGNNKELLITEGTMPDWSPKGDKLVFILNRENSKLGIYDLDKNESSILIPNHISNSTPRFSPDGDKILYLHDVPSSYNIRMNVWLYEINTENYTEIINCEKNDFLEVISINWIDNNHFLFDAYDVESLEYILYKFSFVNNSYEKLFDYYYGGRDYHPIISPDKENLAFLSHRSGKYAIWIYNFNTNTYKMITGFEDDESISIYDTRIQWINNNTICYNTFDNKVIKITF